MNCACPHFDEYACIVIRYGVQHPDVEPEFCECPCHWKDDDDDDDGRYDHNDALGG